MINRLFILLISILAGVTCLAQEYTFKHLTNADGLLSELRLSMAEDRFGRLWISSDEGLTVFDGYEMNYYTKENGSGLLFNFLDQVFCDSKGTIWISGQEGLQYKKENEKLFKELTYADSSIKKALICGQTSEGNLLLASGKYCYIIKDDKSVTILEKLSKLVETRSSPVDVRQLKNDEWLFCLPQNIVLANIKQQKIIKSFSYTDPTGVCKINDTSFITGSYSKDTIAIVNTNTGKITPINNWKSNTGMPMGGYMSGITAIGNSRYAVGSRYFGLYIIDVKDSSYEHVVSNPAIASSLRSNFLQSLFYTSDGTLFINAPGLSYTRVKPQPFKSLTVFTNEKGIVFKGSAMCFTEDADKNFLWIGTNKYLVKWNRETGLCNYYTYLSDKAAVQKLRTIRRVATDAKNRIWAVGFGAGLGMLKPDGTFKYFVADSAGKNAALPGNEIYGLTKTRGNQFLISSNGGFCFFDPLTEKFQTFYEHPKLKPIAGSITLYATTDTQDNIWIGNRTGLYCYNKKLDSLIKIKLPKSASTKFIFTIAQDSSGNIYAAGRHGVYVISKGSYSVERNITKNDGLQGEYILGLLCDGDNNIWISGNRGLARYNYKKNSVEAFGAGDGVLQGNHKIAAYYKSPENEIFIGCEDGFNYFFPDKVRPQQYPLKVFNTSIQIADSLIMISGKVDLSLPGEYSTVAINYLTVDFNMAGFIQYRYKLIGFDTGYVYAGRQRQARYTNLPAGNYSFVAEASLSGNTWYAGNEPLEFTIAQVFWKQWWFILLIAVLAISAVYSIYRFRVQQIRNKVKLRSDYEIKLNELENSVLRTQMNPHFIFNSLNTINAFISSNDRHQAHQYISKFSKLVRLTLDHSREKRITLNEEVRIVTLYMQLEKIRFSNCFDYEIDTGGIDTEIFEVPPMIIQPFIENAILHGLLPKKTDGFIKISMYNKITHILCIVEDNGIGRHASAVLKAKSFFERKSHGMDITIKRIDLFNSAYHQTLPLKIIDLYDHNNEPAGTRVEIALACE